MTDPRLYPRNYRYPYNLSEEEMREALSMYYVKVRNDIIQQLNVQYAPVDVTEDTSILEVIVSAIDSAFTEGMVLAGNTSRVADHYFENTKRKPKVTEYEFKDNMGISGVLTAEGEFLMCGNAEHYIVAEHTMFPDQIRSVFFTSMLDGRNTGTVTLSPFGPERITAEQKTWIWKNWSYLDDNQRKMYHDILAIGKD